MARTEANHDQPCSWTVGLRHNVRRDQPDEHTCCCQPNTRTPCMLPRTLIMLADLAAKHALLNNQQQKRSAGRQPRTRRPTTRAASALRSDSAAGITRAQPSAAKVRVSPELYLGVHTSSQLQNKRRHCVLRVARALGVCAPGGFDLALVTTDWNSENRRQMSRSATSLC